MNIIRKLIENRFKDRVDKLTYEKYLKMGEILDEAGQIAWTWDANDCLTYQTKRSKVVFENLNYIPTLDDWTKFLNDDIIDGILTDLVIKSKRRTFRTLLSQIEENKEISPQQLKALDGFRKLIEHSETSGEQLIYVQYLAPYQNCEDNEKLSDEIIKEFVINE